MTIPEERKAMTIPEERKAMTIPEERKAMTIPEEQKSMCAVKQLPYFLQRREFAGAADVVLIERKGASP